MIDIHEAIYIPENYLGGGFFFSNKWHQYLHEGWGWKYWSWVPERKHPPPQIRSEGPGKHLNVHISAWFINVRECCQGFSTKSQAFLFFYFISFWGLIYSKWSRTMHYSARWDKYLLCVFMHSFFGGNAVIFPSVHRKRPVIPKRVIVHLKWITACKQCLGLAGFPHLQCCDAKVFDSIATVVICLEMCL